jgi:acyl-coenzyme A synthetase/AMP-(fatty) acid ligase
MNTIENSVTIENTIIKSLQQHCSKLLASYMLPKKILLLNNIPKNANGKLDRNQIKIRYKDYFLHD